MTCEEAQQTFAWYWDLADGDPRRLSVDLHTAECRACQEELKLWEESRLLIRALAEEDAPKVSYAAMNRDVMDRIYREQSWLTPLRRRGRALAGHVRRRSVAALACCMVFFMVALAFMMFGSTSPAAPEQIIQMPGMLDGSGVTTVSAKFNEAIPMASISDPFVLNVPRSVPTYLITMSVAGLLMTLLAMNWLLRTRT
ncbi:hypothetical protein [Paenibacillus sp. 1P07SE]|uniref:hypothetical protein n=1 Tax=Paenibacillus sp. 1P07SE TaxID=3132209 RepID=UPI0039A70088